MKNICKYITARWWLLYPVCAIALSAFFWFALTFKGAFLTALGLFSVWAVGFIVKDICNEND